MSDSLSNPDPPLEAAATTAPNTPTPNPQSPPSTPLPRTPAIPPPSPHTPVQRRTTPPSNPAKNTAGTAEGRRDFFSEAMRETLAPFTGIIERRLNPILAALEAIPTEAEKLANVQLPQLPHILDQPQTRSLSPEPEPLPLPADRFLRPPGAMDPGQFESVCSRCARCVDACPANAILLDPQGYMADGFPYIIPGTQPCVVCDSLACMKSCPTGALKLVDRLKIKIGTARVDHTLCVRSYGENCTRCVDDCPITADPDNPDSLSAIFIHPHSGKVRVRKNICVGCGLCEKACPTQPAAITITPYTPPNDPIIA